tara:strand:+ start:272 stop:1393 length:1122 start_codon:yes stop_codon:yes gene_type:complete
MDKFIPVNEPLLGEREKQLLLECIETGWISSEGPFVERFENLLSTRVNRKYGISCANGTAALEIAFAALKIGPGDEVIMPTFTIISCAAAVTKRGATPVLVDVDKDTWNMKTDKIEELISPNTAAIMAVHIYGLPVDMDPLISIAKKYNIYLIEDAAELIGANYKNKPCGSFGDISTFSFYPNKHVTTGEGGMLVTNNLELSNRCKELRNLCFQNDKRFIHEEIGWNYRMTNLQAALGIAQLEKLDKTIERKRQIGKTYNYFLKNVEKIKLPLEKTDYAENIYWVYGIILDTNLGEAKHFINQLKKLKVGSRPFFYPIHKQPVYQKIGLFKNIKLNESVKLYNQGLYLPSGLTLNYSKIKEVCERLISIMNSL